MAVLHEGRFLRLLDVDGWEFVDRPASHGVVQVVATYNQHILLVEQFRHSHSAMVVSLPGGLIDAADTASADAAETAARRELLEETGFSASQMRRILRGATSPGMSTEVITFFSANELERIGKPEGDGDERLSLHEIPIRDVLDWLEAKRETALIDLKVFIGLAVLGLFPADPSLGVRTS